MSNKNIIFKVQKRENVDFSNISTQYCDEIKYINMLFCQQEFPHEKKIKEEIKKKIYGYKNQDVKKNRHDPDKLITLEETTELLVASKLKCHYCNNSVHIFYDNVREKQQWTLERIDNSIGHFKNNVVIACLECNLKRRCIDTNRFKYSKSFGDIKKIN